MMTPSRKKLYNAWHGMLTRAAGIGKGKPRRICESWRKSFEAFVDDVGPAPSSKHVLCLRKAELGFEPANVYWGTRLERQQTVENARQISFKGKTQSLSGWARELGLSIDTLRNRIEKWPLSKALSRQRWTNRVAPRTRSISKSSKFVGVSYRPRDDAWEAKIRVDGKLLYLGLHREERQAAAAVARARLEIAAERLADRLRRCVKRGAQRETIYLHLRELIQLASSAAVTFPRWESHRLCSSNREAGIRTARRVYRSRPVRQQVLRGDV